jgi:SprB repeat
MKKNYLLIFAVLFFSTVLPSHLLAQNCSAFNVSYKAYESRCAATGSIKIVASGGSGNYKYMVAGPITTGFTSTDSITGLSAGTYVLTAVDINTNCTVVINNVRVPGTYEDPRFTLTSNDVSCDNGSNGSISLATQTNGRAPFTYSIIAPSPMGVGTSNSTGTFNGLRAGIYTIRLTDSCGGIQTRLVTINNYTWKIDSAVFRKINCDTVKGYIRVTDNKGNISTITGVPGLLYGIVRSPGDTLWSNSPYFTFYIGSQNRFDVVVKDACGKIKKFPATVSFTPSLGANVRLNGLTCNSFSAGLTNISNFFNPRYCLLDNNGAELMCNSSGSFNNLSYGSYCITAHDACTDTTIKRCFTVTPPAISIDNNARITNRLCNSFDASITGQNGLTNPNFCLFDSAGVQLSCNTTGSFSNLPYGNYCIRVADGCRDTTIERCFSSRRPAPVLPAVIAPGYYTCTSFGIITGGDSLFNPRFCLLDSIGQIIACNTSGIFDSLQYGNYCISVYDSCYDTTITRCISILGPQINGVVSSQTSNLTCSTFDATVTSTGLINPGYCLYSSADSLIGCNATGIFNGLRYGTYYVKTRNACPDTTLILWFSARPPAPSLGSAINISNRTCATFSVNTSGGQNLTNANYCLYDSTGTLISCNSTGTFSNIQYGYYCIKVQDGCYDTTISRCFRGSPLPLDIRVSSSKSCSYGFARLSISVTGGAVPVNVKVLRPNGSLFYSGTYISGTLAVDSVPATLAGEQYKIIATDNCGNSDTAFITTVASSISRTAVVIPRCPSSTWTNGSGSIQTTVVSNMGSVTIRIIRKDNRNLSPALSPSNVAGNVQTFNNLGPGRYVIRYRPNDGCGKSLYDTLVVPPYQYPGLERSSAYQCDRGGFSIGAVVTNGVGPYSFQIIGSTPSIPSIISPPQTSPVFSINNGETYSLVRLRVLDACGNASLEDASILPLANNGIAYDFNCFQLQVTLTVDSLYNSTYAWYKKHSINGADSIFVGNRPQYFIPYLTPQDTGLYVCHLVVNNGCIKRTYYHRVDGSCYRYLPVTLENFTGQNAGNSVLLNWQVSPGAGIKKYVIERKSSANSFRTIGVIYTDGAEQGRNFGFRDSLPASEVNYYRLKIMQYNNAVTYSNVVTVSRSQEIKMANIYPNPVHDVLNMELQQQPGHQYKVQLLNLVNQVLKETSFNGRNGNIIQLDRDGTVGNGVYVIKIFDLTTGQEYSQKVIYR